MGAYRLFCSFSALVCCNLPVHLRSRPNLSLFHPLLGQGRAKAYIPYVGMVTIILTDYPALKVLLVPHRFASLDLICGRFSHISRVSLWQVGLMGIFVITGNEEK